MTSVVKKAVVQGGSAGRSVASSHVMGVWLSFKHTSGLEPRLLSNLRLRYSRPGTVRMSLEIQKFQTNRLEILHGGTIASLVDLGGSLAVASRGLFATGVSTDLNVTYLSSGGKVGDTIEMRADCEKLGKTLAFTRITFKNSSGELFARGSHTKYIAQAWKDPKNRVEEIAAEEKALLSSREESTPLEAEKSETVETEESNPPEAEKNEPANPKQD
ncbi:Thioesterase/thiol ester dehydrase-isomerase [Sporormia fimetaria CBS 119925]|uniref:Thioesterase/thiol ester dehydrase-isomerase n=1 Tax=Sporormia fimetaria CBS 119925 TaxID=1340428 RepID=A0A6A6VDU5_9PLEO|nr:Thioesterase/thiol ester dehydrase-isomerase [Sporormia fimetaria CBS 119925]